MLKKNRVILWGIGTIYNRMINLLKFYVRDSQMSIVALTAEKLPNCSHVDGYPLIPIKKIADIEYDYIIVMSDDYFEDIVNKAMNIAQVQREKILPYRIFNIPYFDFDKYDILKRKRISIISNNCWGGLVYNTLGFECLSPFKNISFSDDDYIKLLKNLKRYLVIDPVWQGDTAMDENSKLEVPILKLGDIFIKCNHDLDADIAIEKWKRRRKKINWNDLVVEMYTESPVIEKQFWALKNFENKICFVPHKTKEKSVKLTMMPGQTKFWETVISNGGVGSNAIEYRLLDLLLMERIHRIS